MMTKVRRLIMIAIYLVATIVVISSYQNCGTFVIEESHSSGLGHDKQ